MAKGYKYERQRRSGGTQGLPYLSEKDEYIPKTHIGMYSVLRNPKNEAVYMSEEQCQNIRRKTFDALHAIFKKYGSPDYVDLWNYNILAINDVGINFFIINPKLAPIGDLIECFGEEDKLPKDKKRQLRTMISFGINRELLAEYFHNVDIAKKTGSKVKIPQLPPLPPKTREEVIFGQSTIQIDDAGSLTIDRNAIYNRFQHWCTLQGVDEQRGALMALEALFKRYPIDGLNSTDYYHVVTELDRKIFTPRKADGTETVEVELSSLIYGQAKAIIERYNADPANLSKSQMAFDTYANNALHLLNNNMPLVYRDPELLKDRQNTEKIEQGK